MSGFCTYWHTVAENFKKGLVYMNTQLRLSKRKLDVLGINFKRRPL